MTRCQRLFLTFAICVIPSLAQTESRYLEDILKDQSLPPEVALFQLRQYILHRVGKLSVPKSAADWTQESSQIRRKLLDDVVFHGWPKAWVEAPPKFEDLGVTP